MACCALCCRVVMFVMKAGDNSHVLGIFSWDWLKLRRSPGSVVTCVHLKLFCENYFSLGLSRAGLWQFPMTRTRARDTSQSSHALSALCSVLVAARQSWAELGRANVGCGDISLVMTCPGEQNSVGEDHLVHRWTRGNPRSRRDDHRWPGHWWPGEQSISFPTVTSPTANIMSSPNKLLKFIERFYKILKI